MSKPFDSLPDEVLRSILAYMDIPSLAALSMTQKPIGNLASLASDDVTWYEIVQRRFGIGCNHRRRNHRQNPEGVVLVKRGSSSSLSEVGKSHKRCPTRPQTYGGPDWKNAYQALSSTMRIPGTSLTSGSSNTSSGGAVFASPCRRQRGTGRPNGCGRKSTAADFLGIWCMVSHAENCQTKTVEGQSGRARRRHNRRSIDESNIRLPYRLDRRYMELKLCLQNTKSGFGRIAIPHMLESIRMVSVDEEDYFSAWGWDKWDGDYDQTFQIVKHGPWAPKMLLRRCFSRDVDYSSDEFDSEKVDSSGNVSTCDVILRPFETILLSLHISCPTDMVYETDVLSTISSIRIPVVSLGWHDCRQVDNNGHCNKGGSGVVDVASAQFLPEDALWDYYCLLPGGCLSLKDRSRLVPF